MSSFDNFANASREDELKAAFLDDINVQLDMRFNIDCYTDNVLFEFKYDYDIRRPDVLAQALYYLNILKNNGEIIPKFICLINKYEASVFTSNIFQEIYNKDSLFVTGSPSNPNENIIQKAAEHINELYYSSSLELEEDYFVAVSSIKDIVRKKRIVPDKIKITNVRRAYNGYVRQLGNYILDSSSSNGVFEFRADAIGRATVVSQNMLGDYVIDFQFDNGAKRIENISKSAYDSYWMQWKRITDNSEAIDVFKTIYDLLGLSDRRTKGQFYTPKNLAKEAWKRITEVLGDNFWQSGNWRIWDCCAGTGNLEYEIIPNQCKQYMYLSTLDIEEVDQLKQKFPISRGIFQFNFLDDHNNKLPQNLKDDMSNEDIKWLFLINPPYVEAQGKSGVQGGTTQSNLQYLMQHQNLGDAAREMFAQFLYRIEKDFKNKYFLGLFSEVKFIVSKKFEAFRLWWRPTYKGGFVVNASEHFQHAKEWPLVFSLFDRTFRQEYTYGSSHWDNQVIKYDVFDKNLNIIGEKIFNLYDKNNNLRNYFPNNSRDLIVKMPLLSSGIKLSTGKEYCSPYGPNNFIGTMVFIGPDFQQQNRCFIASGITNTNHNNIYLTEGNYKDVLIGFALYKAPQITWLNNKDCFKIPNRELTNEEKSDCILYSLVSPSNQSASYRFDDGSIIENKLNPLDTTMFNFNDCSEVGKKVFELLKKYLEIKVNYKQINTPFGKGKFLGLYQYKLQNNLNQCYGIKYDVELEDAIEELRIKIENLSLEVCF